MGSKRKRNVAWGFFRASVFGYRELDVRRTLKTAIEWHEILAANGHSNPGPIFRITPPKPSAGKRGKAK